MKTCRYGCGKMKAGGPIKKVKKMNYGGVSDDGPGKKKKKNPPEFNKPITLEEVPTSKKPYKNPLMARAASYFTKKTEYQKNTNPITNMTTVRTYKDGKKTRVLKNKNMDEKKMGGAIKRKMAKGGATDYNYGIPLNGLPLRPTNGNTDISKNQMGTNPTMKKGGAIKKTVKRVMIRTKKK